MFQDGFNSLGQSARLTMKDETAFDISASAGTPVALFEFKGFEAALMRIRVFVKLKNPKTTG